MLHVHVTMHNLRVNDTFIACLFSIENCSRAHKYDALPYTAYVYVECINFQRADISYDFHMLDIQQSYTYVVPHQLSLHLILIKKKIKNMQVNIFISYL